MALAGWLVATVIDHGGRAVYDLPPWAVALGVVAALAALAGGAVLVRTGRWLGVAIAVLGSLIVASIGVIPVVGVLLFVGGMVWMASASQGRPDRASLAAGLLVAVGLPVAALVATDGPVVRCHDDGVSTSSSIFRGTDSSSGSGTGTGTATEGQLDQGGRRYTYRCDGGKLVEFQAR